MLQTLIIHNEHHEIHAFNADLKAETSASHRDESRCTPAFIRSAAGGNSSTMFGAYHETTLHQVRNHYHTLGAIQHLFRNSLVRRVHNLLQYLGGGLQA